MSTGTLLVGACLLLAQAGEAAPPREERLTAALARGAKLKVEYLRQLEIEIVKQKREIERLERGIVRAGSRRRVVSGSVPRFTSALDKRDTIAEADQRLVKLEEQSVEARQEPLKLPPLELPLRAGAVGRIPQSRCRVDQVLSDRSAKVTLLFADVEMTFSGVSGLYGKRPVTTPMQVILRDYPTSRFTAGRPFTVLDSFEAVGTQEVETESGAAETLFVLRPIPEAVITKIAKAQSAVVEEATAEETTAEENPASINVGFE